MKQWLRGSPRVLLVASDRAVLFLSEGGVLRHAYEFAADEAGLLAFEQYLQAAPGLPVQLLVDVVEEEYRQETLPHVRGRDRQAVLARRYSRLFRGTPYCLALTQGREREGRRDERVLLAAITRPEILTSWVERLALHRVPLAGIHSLPVLSAALARRLGAMTGNVLLVSVQQASGLRQTFLRDGVLRISRLAPMPRAGSIPYADFVLTELSKLRRYLNSLALVSRESPLAIYLLSHGPLLTELEQHCRNTEGERYFLVDTASLAPDLGLPESAVTASSDMLFAQLLLAATPRVHYATRADTRFHRLYRIRNGLVAASLLMLLGSASWSALRFIDGVSLRQAAQEAGHKAAFYAERARLARASLPPTRVPPATIREVVQAAASLEAHRSTPAAAFAAIAAILDTQPLVMLKSLRWSRHYTADPGAVPPPAAAPPLPATAADDAWLELTELEAELIPFDGDYRAAMQTVEGLCARLRDLPRVRGVDVLRYPLDLRSSADVTGSTRPAGTPPQAVFTLRIAQGVALADAKR